MGLSSITGPGARRALKHWLARTDRGAAATSGTTVLIYHRIGGGTADERDLAADEFAQQVDVLQRHRVVGLDQALDELATGDDRPKVVLTFDDGFADVHAVAWPLLEAAGLPFTIYVTSGCIGGRMAWEGSTARQPGPALSWGQLAELAASPLVTIGNHTHTHARPEKLSTDELDRCTATLQDRLGVTPAHFAYTWGIPVPAAVPLLRQRFRSAATGRLGRNHPHTDPLWLRRIPVRGTDPLPFFSAKLSGGLRAERAYERIVTTAKRVGARA